MELKDTRIVLTGAASGIGQALMVGLAKYPVRMIVADWAADLLTAAVADVTGPAEIIPWTGDLSEQAQVDELFACAQDTLGGIDLFIANAGYAYYEQVDHADWERLERLYRINVFSPIYSTVKMRELYGTQPYKMVITASALGLLALPGYAVYAGAKSSLHRFAEGYRLELDDPRKLMLVYPVGTRTRFFETAGENTPYSWPIQTPEHVAATVIRGIERDAMKIHPSKLFLLGITAAQILPFLARLVQYNEGRRFKRWLQEQA